MLPTGGGGRESLESREAEKFSTSLNSGNWTLVVTWRNRIMRIVLVALCHTDERVILDARCGNGGTRCMFLTEERFQTCYLLAKWNKKP